MRGIAYEDEPYVRLYTRRTAAWKALPWEARAVYHELLRDLDRAGVIPLDGLPPAEAAAALTGYPPEVCERGVTALLLRGWLRDDPSRGCLVDPEHLARETARRSDKARAKEYRERRRNGTSSPGVEPASQDVTDRHIESHGVTSSHSLLCFALPCSSGDISTTNDSLSNQGGVGGESAPPEPVGLAASGQTEPKPVKYSADFEEWWSHLPSDMKQSKGQAFRSWKTQAPHRPALAEMIRAVEQAKKSDPRFLPNVRGQTFIPHASTWLNGHGWNDACNQPGFVGGKHARFGNAYSTLAPPPGTEESGDEDVVY